ncbi:MAG: hypothetical protein IPQ01_14995 [Zoogloea sp.]|nr:hypothetical protein [Zoogloea sp.]
MQIRSNKLAGLLLLSFAGSAAAHDSVTPAEDRLAVSGGFGLMSLHADDRYPAARLPGVLEAGSPRADERRDGLDYAEIALRARFTEQLRGFLKVAHHGGRDARNETEEAWLDGRTEMGHDQQLALRAGRQLLPLGLLNPIHMHAWDFGIAPLALRGAINESWRADGFNLNWQLPAGWSAGAGAWRNQGFPGADAGGLKLLTARAGWKNEALQLEAGYANVNADGRALVTTGNAGHTHSVPSCTRITTGPGVLLRYGPAPEPRSPLDTRRQPLVAGGRMVVQAGGRTPRQHQRRPGLHRQAERWLARPGVAFCARLGSHRPGRAHTCPSRPCRHQRRTRGNPVRYRRLGSRP